MPGMGLEIDGAMQQAPQLLRQSISTSNRLYVRRDNNSRPCTPPDKYFPFATFWLRLSLDDVTSHSKRATSGALTRFYSLFF